MIAPIHVDASSPTLNILFLAVSCESVGLFGFGGVKGDKAKEEILAVATQANVIQCAAFGGSVNTGSCVVLGIVIDGVVVVAGKTTRDFQK